MLVVSLSGHAQIVSSVHTVRHAGHQLKILWGKSQATVPAPGKKGGRELAPDPGLPEGMHIIVL